MALVTTENMKGVYRVPSPIPALEFNIEFRS